MGNCLRIPSTSPQITQHLGEVAALPEQATLHALRLEARSTARASRLIEFLREWFAAPSWERPPA